MKTFSTHFIRENNSSIVFLSVLTSLHKSVTIFSTVVILVSSALTLLDKSVTLSSTVIILDLFLLTLLDKSSTDFLVDMAQYGLNEFTYEEISKEEFLRRN